MYCQNCQHTISEEDKECIICDFPLQGTEKEQAKFLAKQVMLKTEVESSASKIEKSRVVLFAIGVFYIGLNAIPLIAGFQQSQLAGIIVNLVIGIFFIGFGFLSYKYPKVSFLIPLVMIILTNMIMYLIDPFLVIPGLIWKLISVSGLFIGIITIFKAEKIMRLNPYLASQIKNNK